MPKNPPGKIAFVELHPATNTQDAEFLQQFSVPSIERVFVYPELLASNTAVLKLRELAKASLGRPMKAGEACAFVNSTGTTVVVIEGEPSDPRNVTRWYLVDVETLKRRRPKITVAQALEIVRERWTTNGGSPSAVTLLRQ